MSKVIPINIHDPAVVVDRFVQLGVRLGEAIDKSIGAHDELELAQGYPPATPREIVNVLAHHLIGMWGSEAVQLFSQAAQEAIRYGARKYSDEMPPPGADSEGADAG